MSNPNYPQGVQDEPTPVKDYAYSKDGGALVDEESASSRPSTDSQPPEQLKRALKTRHMVMISIGGIIGPGLLVGSGNALASAGPVGALIAFAVTGLIIFFVMQSLGELATMYSIRGSFVEYAGNWVDPALGFVTGWLYWELWISVLSNEYVSVGLVLAYWETGRVVPTGKC